MPTPENSLRRVDSPHDGHCVSVGSVIFCWTSCVVSQVEQAYSYVGTDPPIEGGGTGTHHHRVLIVPGAPGRAQSGPSARLPGAVAGSPVAFVAVNRLLVIALGGILGSLGRFAVAHVIGPWDPGRLPWATLLVNVAGCLAIGMVAASTAVAAGPAWLRPFLITGILGGFTTFSALALETGLLLDSGRVAVAAGYVAATMVCGLLAVRLGMRVVGGGR